MSANTESGVQLGWIEPQVAMTYSDASLLGQYAHGSVAPGTSNTVTVTATVNYDGAGAFSDYEHDNSPIGLMPDGHLLGAAAVQSNGRVVLSSGSSGAVAVQYLVSPVKYVEILLAVPVTPPENKTILYIGEQ